MSHTKYGAIYRTGHVLPVHRDMAGLLLVAVAISAQRVCVDDAKWDNHSGKSCADYSAEGWCNGHGFKPGKEWTGGEHFNWPERNC